MLDVEGFILVGGASSRMGADKSRLVFEGQTSVERIAESLRPITPNISVVGFQAEANHPLRNIPDVHPRWGPLGGIHAGLRTCKTAWCIVVACDLPFVTTQLVRRLSSLINDSDAVVPVQSDAHPQPLCALYRVQPCLIAAREAIANAEHSPRALLDKVRTRYVEFSELSDLDGSEHFFFNVNTPENYERAQQIASCQNLER